MFCHISNIIKTRKREQGYRLHIRNFSIERGKHVAITGPSGCGKSTVLDTIGMILRPDSGDSFEFNIDGKIFSLLDLWQRGDRDAMSAIRRSHIGYVLQTGELIPYLNVQQNIRLTASLAKRSLPPLDDLMEELGIAHLRYALPKTLSLGERQRAAICRALASTPDIILADEPTAALDPRMARIVMRLFLKTVSSTGAAIIMVSHDVNLAREFSFKEIPMTIQNIDDSILAVLDDSNQDADAEE